MTRRFTAVLAREEPGWEITVPEVERVTYAQHLRDVRRIAADLAAIMTDERVSEDQITLQYPAKIAEALDLDERAREDLAEAEELVRRRQFEAVLAFRREGVPFRDIAAELGFSHQRAQQVFNAGTAAVTQSYFMHEPNRWALSIDPDGERSVTVATKSGKFNDVEIHRAIEKLPDWELLPGNRALRIT